MTTSTYYKYTRYAAYIAVFVGTFIGIHVLQSSGNATKAITLFVQIGIIPLAGLAFLWHTLLSGNVQPQEASKFFEYEAGGANLGVAFTLTIATLYDFGLKAICSILILYFIYLAVGAITHCIYNGAAACIKFCPILIILLYFIIRGLAQA